jgi:hypothetical protein
MESIATAIAHKCFTCNSKINPHEFHIKYGQKYCSLSCQDIGEERNQGDESILFELEEQEV